MSGEAWIDTNGEFCDKIGRCDSFIKIRVNDVEVYNTRTHDNIFAPNYDETYTSDEPIPKDSTILIQMWDYDPVGANDLMSEWNLAPSDVGSCKTLFGDKEKEDRENYVQFKRNRLFICTEWLA